MLNLYFNIYLNMMLLGVVIFLTILNFYNCLCLFLNFIFEIINDENNSFVDILIKLKKS